MSSQIHRLLTTYRGLFCLMKDRYVTNEQGNRDADFMLFCLMKDRYVRSFQ